MNSYRKAKTVAKDVLTIGPDLERTILTTMKKISDIVGATLGPSGRAVLIERQEYGLPHMFTKDGVTVFRNLGFNNPTEHAIMEAARDAATRTVAEAGDGTTTATVLAEAIVRNTYRFCKDNPKVSPTKVVRKLEQVFKEVIEPTVKSSAIKADEKMLHHVAKLSANGDEALAKAVMECFELVGDDGNISIIEQNGPSNYEVEGLKGFPITMGTEESCGAYFQLFLNDQANNRTFMENPVFILYHGSITEIQTVLLLLEKIGAAWEDPKSYGLEKKFNHNVVLVAHNFSATVLGHLGRNFAHPKTINVFPLLTPKGPIQNGQLHFLHDLAAVTGATVFDPVTKPLDEADFRDLGYGIEAFEANRYRSTISGICDESLILMRAEEVKRSIAGANSKLDEQILQERVGKLTGGIAKLKVVGASNGELREKRDRAEDAVCAVRGAKKYGCLPGGGWMLNTLCSIIRTKYHDDPILMGVLVPSLYEPIERIFRNCGMNEEEVHETILKIGVRSEEKEEEHIHGEPFITELVPVVYDAWEGKTVDAIEGGILDSTPAVLEAIRSSLSIASLLGTAGGTVVFRRDEAMEVKEAVDSADFMKQFDAND